MTRRMAVLSRPRSRCFDWNTLWSPFQNGSQSGINLICPESQSPRRSKSTISGA
nr:MAG TPA: hypothetical protein [Caudoviricetes sp.]